MSTTILIQDKEDTLPTYQSLSTPIEPKRQRYEFSEYIQKSPSNTRGLNILHCCYFTFFIFAITAISCGGYYCFIKPNEIVANYSIDVDKSDNLHQPSVSVLLENHHYKLISEENNDNETDSYETDGYETDSNEVDDKWDYELLRKSKIAFKKVTSKTTTSSGLYFNEQSSKIKISDVVGDVHIGN